jgi:hypothetical protein
MGIWGGRDAEGAEESGNTRRGRLAGGQRVEVCFWDVLGDRLAYLAGPWFGVYTALTIVVLRVAAIRE